MSNSNQYERLGKVAIDVVLNATIGKANILGVEVNTDSLRLRTFRTNGQRCSCCGLQAQYYAIERHKGTDNKYHINLWGVVNEKEVLFTHDHTLARSLGGRDSLDNTTTMCSPCNSKKSVGEHRQLRSIGTLVPEISKRQARVLRKQHRLVKQQERYISDPEYAAKVDFHANRLASI